MVQVSYKVGDQQCDCPNKAKQLAAESGEKVTFVVNDQETCCPIGSKLNLARAKFRAALQTVSATIDDKTTDGSGSKCSGPWSMRGSTYRAKRSHSAAWG